MFIIEKQMLQGKVEQALVALLHIEKCVREENEMSFESCEIILNICLEKSVAALISCRTVSGYAPGLLDFDCEAGAFDLFKEVFDSLTEAFLSMLHEMAALHDLDNQKAIQQQITERHIEQCTEMIYKKFLKVS